MDDFFQNYLSTAPAHFADLFAETDEDLDSEDKKIWDDSMSSGNEISSLSVFQAGTLSQLNISTGEPGRIHSHGAVILPIIDFLIRYNQQNNPSRVVFVRSLHTHPPRPETDHFSMSDLQVMYRLKILLELGGLENTAIQMQLLYQNEGSNPRKKTWTIPSSVSCFDGQYNMCPTFTLELAQFIERNPDISRIDLLRAYQASLLLEQ